MLKVIRDATMKLAGQGYRTDVVIRLDIRPGFEGQIHAKQELVNEILSKITPLYSGETKPFHVKKARFFSKKARFRVHLGIVLRL